MTIPSLMTHTNFTVPANSLKFKIIIFKDIHYVCTKTCQYQFICMPVKGWQMLRVPVIGESLVLFLSCFYILQTHSLCLKEENYENLWNDWKIICIWWFQVCTIKNTKTHQIKWAEDNFLFFLPPPIYNKLPKKHQWKAYLHGV